MACTIECCTAGGVRPGGSLIRPWSAAARLFIPLPTIDPFDLLFGGGNTAPSDPTGHPWERCMLRTLALGRAASEERDGRIHLPDDFRAWLAEHAEALGSSIREIGILRGNDANEEPPSNPMGALKVILDHRVPAPLRSPLQKRLDWVAATLGLDAIDVLVLGICAQLAIVPAFRARVDTSCR